MGPADESANLVRPRTFLQLNELLTQARALLLLAAALLHNSVASRARVQLLPGSIARAGEQRARTLAANLQSAPFGVKRLEWTQYVYR